MATDGFKAYDISIMEDVLVTSVVLFFLVDSPMHAEITNTPNPGPALNPCRMCTLSVKKIFFKRSPTYVQRFLQIDALGMEVTFSFSTFILAVTYLMLAHFLSTSVLSARGAQQS